MRTFYGALRRATPGGVVLLYHRVAEPAHDPWGIAVSPARFTEQMEILASTCRVVPLERMVSGEERGAHPVAITFDDGYRDNLHHALPVLAARGLPATFFVTSGAVGSERELWWDELARLVLSPRVLPREIWLALPDGRVGFPAGHTEPGSVARAALYRRIWNELLPQPSEIRRAALDALAPQCAAPPPSEQDLPLSVSEVQELARAPGAAIGAHTVTHPALPLLSPEHRRREIAASRERLRELIGHAVDGFAYPHGRNDEATRAAVREAGFGYACGDEPGRVGRKTDRYAVPRYGVRNWNGDELARVLTRLGAR